MGDPLQNFHISCLIEIWWGKKEIWCEVPMKYSV